MSSRSIEKIPTYALPYMINGDATNLYDDEIEKIDNIFREYGIESVIPKGEEHETYFSNSPMFGKPTEVMDCIVIYK